MDSNSNVQPYRFNDHDLLIILNQKMDGVTSSIGELKTSVDKKADANRVSDLEVKVDDQQKKVYMLVGLLSAIDLGVSVFAIWSLSLTIQTLPRLRAFLRVQVKAFASKRLTLRNLAGRSFPSQLRRIKQLNAIPTLRRWFLVTFTMTG
jgi:hypothetical protein